MHFNEYLESSSKKLVGNTYCMHICPVNKNKPKQPKYLLNMKKITFILFALIAGTTFAQDNATATVNAKIVTPIKITNSGVTVLDFGYLAVPASADTDVIVATAGTRAAVTDVTLSGGTVSAATFQITADLDYNYTIDIADITLNGPSDTMALTFAHDDSSLKGTGSPKTVNVGGTLTIKTTQASGNYNGTVAVIVAYQ
jgi:spore coat protein U-like protein